MPPYIPFAVSVWIEPCPIKLYRRGIPNNYPNKSQYGGAPEYQLYKVSMLILYSDTSYSAKKFTPLYDYYIVPKSYPIENTQLRQTSENNLSIAIT